MKTSANVVGRRLRRYLGALLAAGFGVTWWSFVPPAAAAVLRPAPAIAMAPELVELRWSQTAMEPATPPPIVKPEPRVHRPKPDSTPVVVVADPVLVPVLVPALETPTPDPIVVPDPQPEPIDEFPPIRTRSSR